MKTCSSSRLRRHLWAKSYESCMRRNKRGENRNKLVTSSNSHRTHSPLYNVAVQCGTVIDAGTDLMDRRHQDLLSCLAGDIFCTAFLEFTFRQSLYDNSLPLITFKCRLKTSISHPTSTRSAFSVLYKNALYQFSVINNRPK